MDNRIFMQLHQLERGARIEEPRHVQPDYSSTEYSAYDGGYESYYTCDVDHNHYHHDDFVDQPLTLDSFDEQLLRQPDQDSRQVQAAQGNARLSLPSSRPTAAPPRGSELKRFAFESGQASSSSAFEQPEHSSPAFKASQRRPAVYDAPRGSQRPQMRPPLADVGQASAYRPITIEQLQEGERSAQATAPPPPYLIQRSHSNTAARPAPSRDRTISAPRVQGIELVSTHELPDRFRAIFPFPLFNAVQSKCFGTIYRSNDNFVLSSPTGSGKTAVLELAICRLINSFSNGSYKIVYQAPTKSLCFERQRDWQAKFGPLDLQCAELTGDTDSAQLRNVQHATIIVTTPEKWDSMTRKWKDHQKLMQMIKLVLIDEVHILKEDRGATLEAVVSRMKSMGSDMRFVALSATVPNYQDIATWLGRTSTDQHTPAVKERFGEEFRPVKLQKHVCGYQANSNDFAFDKILDSKLVEVIPKYSQRKPIMVFCFTRNSCVATAKVLANWWATSSPQNRYWSSPRSRINVVEKDLQGTIASGVAYHHAGLQTDERVKIEKGYLTGEIGVICCTSTLAVGVNLPCHMVIIKNTVTYHSASGAGSVKEYSDLEVMQMLGRAGRPQFDNSAVAVIMTRTTRVEHYEKMMTGQEVLESCLHRNLIDHLNAEIGLSTITNAATAKSWLSGTFLYVRLKQNPERYKLDDDVPGRNLDERLEHICAKAIAMLEEHDLVKKAPRLQCTEFGDAMTRYYIQFDTMKTFIALPPQAKVSEILSAIALAREFSEIRFRAGEKATYKDLNKNISIKFPIPVNLDPPAHKVSLVIQSVLGAVDLPTDDYYQRAEYTTAKSLIFQHTQRLIRCIVDCQLYLDDAVASRNALMLARSLSAQVWDDSPLHIMQLEGVGTASVRKLVTAGIRSIEDIEVADARRLETIMVRNPPYGSQLQEKARAFPKLRVSLKAMGQPKIVKGEHITVNVKAEIGFLNEKVPEVFQRHPVYVCLLAEISDGHKIHFARTSAKKLNKGQDLLFHAQLTSAAQSIRAYVMCDGIAGTARSAVLKPDIPASAFPPPKATDQQDLHRPANAPNTSKRRASASRPRQVEQDEFGDAGLDDADLAAAEAGGFVDIDDLDETENAQPKKKQKTARSTAAMDSAWEPRQLPNGKWACKHTCSDKTVCKHLCCREGLDKKPKPPKPKEAKQSVKEPPHDPKQTQLNMGSKKASTSTAAAGPPGKKKEPSATQRSAAQPEEMRKLNRLDSSIKTNTARVPTIASSSTLKAKITNTSSGLSFLPKDPKKDDGDYGLGESWDAEDLPSVGEFMGTQQQSAHMDLPHEQSNGNDDLDMLDAGFDDIVDDPQQSQAQSNGHVDLSSYTGQQEEPWEVYNDDGFDDMVNLAQSSQAAQEQIHRDQNHHQCTTRDEARELFVTGSTSSKKKSDPYYDNAVPIPTREGDETAYNHPASSQYFDHRPPVLEDSHQSNDRLPSRHASTNSTVPRTASAQLRQDFDRSFQQAQASRDDDAYLAQMIALQEPQAEQKPGSDDLAAWFKAEFGEEHFSYVG